MRGWIQRRNTVQEPGIQQVLVSGLEKAILDVAYSQQLAKNGQTKLSVIGQSIVA